MGLWKINAPSNSVSPMYENIPFNDRSLTERLTFHKIRQTKTVCTLSDFWNKSSTAFTWNRFAALGLICTGTISVTSIKTKPIANFYIQMHVLLNFGRKISSFALFRRYLHISATAARYEKAILLCWSACLETYRIYRYSCSCTYKISSTPGVSNIRPVAWLDPARGMILWNKNFFVCLRSISSYTSITGDYRFQLLATST